VLCGAFWMRRRPLQ